MRQAAENRFNREETLGKCFECLVSSGLENTSIRNFSLATGLNSSSLYYWFRDKDEIVLEATLFGLKSIIDDLFTQAYGYLNDLDKQKMQCDHKRREHQVSADMLDYVPFVILY